MKENTKKSVIYTLIVTGFILQFSLIFQNWMNTEEVIVSASEIVPTTTPSPTPTPVLPTEVHRYIYEKFGEDYEKAVKVVMCESRFKLKAFNDNTTWGGVGQDRGIWQINNVYHPVSDACAYDYKCSTDYAYRMYKNDNKNFNRWTCGRK